MKTEKASESPPIPRRGGGGGGATKRMMNTLQSFFGPGEGCQIECSVRMCEGVQTDNAREMKIVCSCFWAQGGEYCQKRRKCLGKDLRLTWIW